VVYERYIVFEKMNKNWMYYKEPEVDEQSFKSCKYLTSAPLKNKNEKYVKGNISPLNYTNNK
jgi:hypothetical protein